MTSTIDSVSMPTFLVLSWDWHDGVLTLTDVRGGVAYRSDKAGDSKIGQALCGCLVANFANEIQGLEARAYAGYSADGSEILTDDRNYRTRLYGVVRNEDGTVQLDGGCGWMAMEAIAAAIGIKITGAYGETDELCGYMVERS